jgi:hypothetical protein
MARMEASLCGAFLLSRGMALREEKPGAQGYAPMGKEMATPLAENFRRELDAIYAALREIPPALAGAPWGAGGWTRKQVMGHLLDSATNNRQRFVRAATEGRYAGPKYAQEAWVAAHGYAGQAWETLLVWWKAEHEILAEVVDRIPEERLEASCVVGADAAVPLRFVIQDYLRHQRHHLEQIRSERAQAERQKGGSFLRKEPLGCINGPDTNSESAVAQLTTDTTSR